MTMLIPQSNLTYTPSQPGYLQFGKHYNSLSYSRDCKLGNYICEIFEVQYPQTNIIPVIPDGCNDIIITFSGKEISSWLSPSITTSSKFHFDRLEWIFGIRFLPGATHAIFRNNLNYDVQQAIDMNLLFKDFSYIEQGFFKSQSFIKRHELIKSYLEEKTRIHDGIGEIINFCVNQLIITNGQMNVRELALKTGYSDRYIRQLFANHVGHSPKELANIIRMQCALHNITENPKINLVEMAHKFGFADQSHMNREFRKFIGVSSCNLKQNDRWISYLNAGKSRIF